MQTSLAKKHDRSKMVLTIAFTVICIVYVLPIVIVLINSFKTNAAVNTDTFALPNEDTFVGWQNYIKGMTFGNYPFIKAVFYSLFITLVSSALILICTSMAAWYVARVGSLFSKIVYYLCVFSMVVPFQMVMFTLSRTAEQVKLPYFSFTSMAFAKIGLNTPWTIPIVYLGFGAGLAVFMFSGFVKTIPLEIEEAAAIDGCGPVRTFFLVVLPMLKPTFISVGVLEIMWVWNDFLLPYLVLDLNKYRTIPIVIQYLKGSYGQVDIDVYKRQAFHPGGQPMTDYNVIRSRRRTLALEVTRQGTALVRAPLRASDADITRFVDSHRGWLEKHLAARQAYLSAHPELSAAQTDAWRQQAKET